MNKTFSNPESVAEPVSNYSHAVRVEMGDAALIFLSSQGSVDKEGNLIGEGDLRRQTEGVFENVRAILEANGATLRDVVKTTIYLTDMSRRAEMAEVRGRYFPEPAPPATAVEVLGLALPGMLIQMEVVAVTGRPASEEGGG